MDLRVVSEIFGIEERMVGAEPWSYQFKNYKADFDGTGSYDEGTGFILETAINKFDIILWNISRLLDLSPMQIFPFVLKQA